MHYPRFIALRREIWDRFERDLSAAESRPRSLAHEDVEDLAFLYRQVLHDHALAAARYPGTGAARRLQRLAVAGTHWLQRGDTGRAFSLRRFVTRSFPHAFRSHLPLLGVAAGLFLVACVFGIGMAATRPAIAVALLGPVAVDGLERGELWTESLTTTVPSQVSSSRIATNNISVALTAWAGGALAGLGALWVVLLNGFMLGAVVGVTAQYSLGGEILEFVAAHGPLEITLILLAAAGGLALGRALIVAQDRPRSVVAQEAARQAMVLLLGCVPWFVVLGLVEVLISPSTDIGTGLKVLVGLALECGFLLMAWNPLLSRKPRPRVI